MPSGYALLIKNQQSVPPCLERELCCRKGRGRRGKRVEFREQFGNRQLHLMVWRAHPLEALIPIVDREYHTAFRGQDRIEQRIAGLTRLARESGAGQRSSLGLGCALA